MNNTQNSGNTQKIKDVRKSIENLEGMVLIGADMVKLTEDERFKRLIGDELFDKQAKVIIEDLATIQRSPADEALMLDKLKSIKLVKAYIENTIAEGTRAGNALVGEQAYLQKLLNTDDEDAEPIGDEDE